MPEYNYFLNQQYGNLKETRPPDRVKVDRMFKPIFDAPESETPYDHKIKALELQLRKDKWDKLMSESLKKGEPVEARELLSYKKDREVYLIQQAEREEKEQWLAENKATIDKLTALRGELVESDRTIAEAELIDRALWQASTPGSSKAALEKMLKTVEKQEKLHRETIALSLQQEIAQLTEKKIAIQKKLGQHLGRPTYEEYVAANFDKFAERSKHGWVDSRAEYLAAYPESESVETTEADDSVGGEE